MDIKAMAGGGIRLLARRLEQAILVCLVGCVVAFCCYNQLWEMISDVGRGRLEPFSRGRRVVRFHVK
jgi:hypothetical protein